MIGRVVCRPKRPHRLLKCLFGPGRNNEHVNPHLVAAWAGHPAHLEPPGEGAEGRQTWRLAQILEMPVALARGKVPKDLVWHCVVSAADTDPRLGDGAWQPVSAEMMHRTGLSVRGEEDRGPLGRGPPRRQPRPRRGGPGPDGRPPGQHPPRLQPGPGGDVLG